MAIHHRDGFACVYCTRVGGRLTLDHVDPVIVKGRANAPGNLVTACLSCNSAKGGKTYRAWLAALREAGESTEVVRRRVSRARRAPLVREVGRFLSRTRRAK